MSGTSTEMSSKGEYCVTDQSLHASSHVAIRDKYSETKQRMKDYTDAKRHARGDQVLVKQKEKNKLSAPYGNEPFEVVDKFNSQVTV